MSSSRLSEIQEFFYGTTVFLTGATGFVGKHVLEKLLRACPGLRHVYLLIRIKKGKDTSTRFNEIFECPIFDILKRKNTKFSEIVTIINGDCAEPNLGMSEQDVNVITSEVNCIIHCAATVRFDQKLSQATKINLRATKDLVAIAHNMKDLKAFVHVSTAFSNCDREEIDELVYPPKMEGEKLLSAINCLSDEMLLDLQPRLLGKLPNTYTLTKQIAESYVKEHGQNLPICIVRPSIIIASAEEPLRGFIDNYYGPTGFVLATALGLLRSILSNPKKTADLVPTDYVVNCILSSAHYTSKKRTDRDYCDPEVFNFVSGPQNPITWGRYTQTILDRKYVCPPTKMLWYPLVFMQPNPYIHFLLWLTLHIMPAYIVEGVTFLLGKKPGLVDIYAKIWTMNDVISYFPLRQWTFSNNNTKKLFEQMSPKDKKLFNFNISDLNWEDFITFYMKGMRYYVLKESTDTIPDGRKHLKKLQIIHYVTCIILFLLAIFLLRYSLSFIF